MNLFDKKFDRTKAANAKGNELKSNKNKNINLAPAQLPLQNAINLYNLRVQISDFMFLQLPV